MFVEGSMEGAAPLGDLESLYSGGRWELIDPNAAGLARGWGQLVSCRQGAQIFMLGGFDAHGCCLSDIYSSSDSGASWNLVCERAPWSGRAVFGAVVSECGSFMYVLGGVSPVNGGFSNDVWLSTDGGVSWVKQASTTAWTVRSGFGVSLNPRDPCDLAIFGGSSINHECLNDTWRSQDGGKTWSLISAGPWTPRVDFGTVTTDGILIAGGDDWEGRFFNDVWISFDRGQRWSLVAGDCAWCPRAGLCLLAVENGDIVLFGGNTTGLKRDAKEPADAHNIQRVGDVWRSFDMGKSWVCLCERSALSKRTMSKIVQGKGAEIILFGGWRADGFSADVWRSCGDSQRAERERDWIMDALEGLQPALVPDVVKCHILAFVFGRVQ